MRRLFFFAPALLLLQTQSALAQVAPPAPAKSTSRPATAKSGTARATSAASKPKPPATMTPPAPLTTDDEKTVYSLGLSIYRSLAQFDLSPSELEILKRALGDAAANKPAVDITQWGAKIEGLARTRGARVAEQQKTAAAEYLTKAAAEPGVVKTDSGLIYKELRAGTGASPKPSDTVKVQYRGTLVNGTEFDSSYSRNEPAQFGLGQVIRCWTEGVGKMKVGGKATLVCPSDLAYGDQGRPPQIPGGATLIFDIELLEILGGG